MLDKERTHKSTVHTHKHQRCHNYTNTRSSLSGYERRLGQGTGRSGPCRGSGEAASGNAETDLSKVAPDMEVDGQVGTCTLISVAAATQTQIRMTLCS